MESNVKRVKSICRKFTSETLIHFATKISHKEAVKFRFSRLHPGISWKTTRKTFFSISKRHFDRYFDMLSREKRFHIIPREPFENSWNEWYISLAIPTACERALSLVASWLSREFHAWISERRVRELCQLPTIM